MTCDLQQQAQRLDLLQAQLLLREVARLQQPEAGRAALVLQAGPARHRPRLLLLLLLLLREKAKGLMSQTAVMRSAASWKRRVHQLLLLHAGAGRRRPLRLLL